MLHWYRVLFFGYWMEERPVAYREGISFDSVLAEFDKCEVESISRVTFTSLGNRPFSEILREHENKTLPAWVKAK